MRPASGRTKRTDIFVVGRDAVAVEAVGATLVGMKPEKIPVIKETVKRGLSVGNIEDIEVSGESFQSVKRRISQQDS